MKSRFLEEMPEEALVVENHIAYDRLGPGGLSYQRRKVARRKRASTIPDRPAMENDLSSVLQAGMRVLHPRFGEGVIESISGFGNGLTCRVAFTSGGTKTIVARYANFEILGA